MLIQALGIENETKQAKVLALRCKKENEVKEGWNQIRVLPLRNYKSSPHLGRTYDRREESVETPRRIGPFLYGGLECKVIRDAHKLMLHSV